MADSAQPAASGKAEASSSTSGGASTAQAPPPAPSPASKSTGAAQQQPTSKPTSPAIPVALNEAALDSPSFRAATARFADQIDTIERWLDGYVRSSSKLCNDLLALEETVNTYLSKVMPPTAAAEAALDPDYTMLALHHAAEGSRQWWTQILTYVRRMDAISIEPVRNFTGGTELRIFKEVRRTLEQTQKTYDTTLARYAGQSKTKEPSSLREDAFAVYETRKAYLRCSMDFCQLASQLRFTVDKLLVRVSADKYKQVKRPIDDVSSSCTRWGGEMERVRGWSKEMDASESVFRRELQLARRDIGETTLASYKPSRELEDYSVSTVPFLGSRGPMSIQHKGQGAAVISEKQGWLFLRVVSGKPIRTSWVRRWYYCRDGIFGWLVQGPSGVLQGDEVGVLLCSVKPAVQDDRRFCFEVKTKTQSFLLQAESQGQLIEWLEVFDVAKKKAMDASMGRDNTSLPGGIDPAFAVTPPSIPEFSAKSLEGSAEDGAAAANINVGIERGGTLPVPGPDGAGRASMDANAGPRRAVTGLAREDGESGREHAARIMQKLDLHRKATWAASGPDGAPAPSVAGGIAGLLASNHTFLPGYSTHGASSSTAPRQASAPAPPFGHVIGSLGPITLARPPVSTALSKTAVVASAERGTAASGPHGVSSAVLANYWGSNPWSSIYSGRTEMRKSPAVDVEDPFIHQSTITQAPSPTGGAGLGPRTSVVSGHRKTASVDTRPGGSSGMVQGRMVNDTFPPGYPPELRAQHAQFRLLFPAVPQHEKLVLVFNAAWASASMDEPKEKKGITGSGRIFVTADNMYFYGHQIGLVVLYTVSLDMISEVTAAPGRDCDYIFLHLSQDLNDTGLSRITLKIFLENLHLLEARLNLLVDDLQAEEPMDLQELVAALDSIERDGGDDDDDDFARRSFSAGSWEEVSSSTPIDDGTARGRPAPHRKVRGHGVPGYPGSKVGYRKPTPKLQLPANPVVYEPEGMGKSVAERHFEISAKACFHVLFGDKSFIFPKLYFDRRAKEIAQGPWEPQDSGGLRRQFDFKVESVDMLGRLKPGQVVDHQTIDLFTDHVTYVVTHVKTPWYLPHSHAFKLVSKVVITHVAKSKCKLAVFTKVDWSRAPAFAKNMVQREALDDAANDAEELAELATDQVRRLGAHSRTKRAIQVYGGLGQQKQVVVFTPDEVGGGAGAGGADALRKPPIKPRTLTDMLLETVRSFMESAISSLMMWSFAGVKKIFDVASAHRVVLFVLGLSALYNVVVTSQATSTWWTERKAAKYMNRIGVGPNAMMSKAIYLADLEEASRGTSIDLALPQDSQW